ncbi:MAG: hypothetical protein NT061_02845 [Spirochaetes bacterium]|nr:hypothetical protein [Spirochaetota bacterium]
MAEVLESRLIPALAKEDKTLRKPHDPTVVEGIHTQIDNLLVWAPEYGAIELTICFHDGKIAKTEERRTVTLLQTGGSS